LLTGIGAKRLVRFDPEGDGRDGLGTFRMLSLVQVPQAARGIDRESLNPER
jgi:hypothetical protein